MSDNETAGQETDETPTLDDAQLEQVSGGMGIIRIPDLTTIPVEPDPFILTTI
jgi:hypothetical protein